MLTGTGELALNLCASCFQNIVITLMELAVELVWYCYRENWRRFHLLLCQVSFIAPESFCSSLLNFWLACFKVDVDVYNYLYVIALFDVCFYLWVLNL